MAPTYSRSVRFPTPRDISRLVELGYPRAVSTPPPSGPSPNESFQVPVTLKVADGVEAFQKIGYEVKKK